MNLFVGVVLLLLIAATNSEQQTLDEQAGEEIEPLLNVEESDHLQEHSKRTIGLKNHGYAKHVGVNSFGHKFVFGYGPVNYKFVPVIKPLVLKPVIKPVRVKPLRLLPVRPVHHHRPLVSHGGWKPLVPVNVPVNVPVPSQQPAQPWHDGYDYRKPSISLEPPVSAGDVHVQPVIPDVHVNVPIQPVHPVPVQPPHPVLPAQPLYPPVQPVYPHHFVPEPPYRPHLPVLPLGAAFPPELLHTRTVLQQQPYPFFAPEAHGHAHGIFPPPTALGYPTPLVPVPHPGLTFPPHVHPVHAPQAPNPFIPSTHLHPVSGPGNEYPHLQHPQVLHPQHFDHPHLIPEHPKHWHPQNVDPHHLHPHFLNPQPVNPQHLHPEHVHPQAFHPQHLNPEHLHPEHLHPQPLNPPFKPSPEIPLPLPSGVEYHGKAAHLIPLSSGPSFAPNRQHPHPAPGENPYNYHADSSNANVPHGHFIPGVHQIPAQFSGNGADFAQNLPESGVSIQPGQTDVQLPFHLPQHPSFPQPNHGPDPLTSGNDQLGQSPSDAGGDGTFNGYH